MEKTRARCAFCGLHGSIDADLSERMRVAMEATLEKYDGLEFLIFQRHTTEMTFLSEAMRLKSRYPDKDVTITKVVSIDEEYGSAENLAGIYYVNRFSDTLPLSIFDNYVYAAEYSGKAKPEDPGYMMHSFHALNSWVYAQSDIIYTYAYSDLPESESNQADRLENKKGKIVIPLCSEQTAARIRELIDELDDREKEFLRRIAAGDSCKQIGRKYGITGSAVSQASHKAARKVRSAIGKEYLRARKERDENKMNSCGIFGLGEQSKLYVYDIDVVLRFLASAFSVEELNIDQSICFSETVGPILAKAIVSYRGFRMVAVLDPESAVEDSEVSVSAYCPPYHSMSFAGVNLLNGKKGEVAVYEHIIENSDFVITDMSNVTCRDDVLAACAKRGTILIDITSIPKLTESVAK